MQYASKTDIGKRIHNEDSLYVPVTSDRRAFVAVADGMGGHAAGAVASGMVIEGMTDAINRLDNPEPVALLLAAVNETNGSVFRASQSDPSFSGMGSTLVCALLYPEHFIAANVGDSRLYHFDGERIARVTTDHSYVEMLVAAGQITDEEARVHPQRNLITRAMGLEKRVSADVFDCPWKPGDLILLCSDGLSGSVTDERLCAVLKSCGALGDVCEKLVAEALENGASDNITLVLARNGEAQA